MDRKFNRRRGQRTCGYSGPLYEQIEDAVAFVLRNIRLGAQIDGLVRKESYELPVAAIREMIINAHCHRKLTEPSCVQVALYDDRLEVTSPGGLYNGLTFEAMMEGRSSIRNRAIANVFNQMGLVESWGTGIRRIMDAAKEYGLPKPQFLEFDDMVRVNLFRQELNEITETIISINEAKNELLTKILNQLKDDPKATQIMLAEMYDVSRSTIQRAITELIDQGKLKRHGSPRGGYWEVTENK